MTREQIVKHPEYKQLKKEIENGMYIVCKGGTSELLDHATDKLNKWLLSAAKM